MHTACKALLCLLFLSFGIHAAAQKVPAPTADTGDKIKIHILKNKLVNYYKTDSGTFYHFLGDVVLQQGTDTLYCDSLYRNETTNIMEAFSNVRIAQQDGTQATCDYLRYTTAKKLAYMKGNVTLTDNKNHLLCDELTYNLDTKTGVYSNGGTLTNDTTKIVSRSGIYNVRNHDARFTGHVVITDPEYNIKSEDLLYNTESKITRFFAQSTVTSDSGKSVLKTKRGTYDSKNVIAHFVGHSSIWNDGQYIEADTMHYNKLTGYGFADGNVISIDTQRHSTLYCGHTEYLRRKGVLWATIKPVLEQVNGKDTLYMRADTFYSAPMIRVEVKKKLLPLKARKDTTAAADTTLRVASPVSFPAPDSITARYRLRRHTKVDTLTNGSVPRLSAPYDVVDTIREPVVVQKKTPDSIWVLPDYKYRMPDYNYDTVRSITQLYKKSKRRKGEVDADKTVVPDTTSADSTAPVYFIGYHHVLIFSDSLQGKCDSVCYTRSDSVIRLIVAPIVWSHNSQITGDTILLHLDSSSIKSLYVPNNAFVASQSGPVKAELWDQIQGKTLTAYFKNNAITNMIVHPNSESIYYSKDEKGAYLGVTQTKSDKMRIFFEDQKITNIKFEPESEVKMVPLTVADLPNTRLSRFKWLIQLRPKNKEELFR